MGPIQRLHELSRAFGPAAAREKRRLLGEIAELGRIGARDRSHLAATLDFLRAYPDDAGVRAAVRDVAPRLDETDIVYPWSYGVLLQLVARMPGRLAIAWEDVEDEGPIHDALDQVVLPAESQGLEDTRLSVEDWFAAATPVGATDLELLLGLFERSPLPPATRVQLFEACRLPVRYRGPGRLALELPPPRVHYQKKEIDRARFPLAPVIRRPFATPARGGRAFVDLALQALCARSLEIYPLIYANPRDVVIADCGRGLRIGLVGVRPEWRSALESVHFFLALKNGAPIAYGPAGVFLGCCEMGINLFPEFRGGEIRYLYAQFMRLLHHRLGVECFFLTRYGMGERNPDAIRSGAFWFYRKLGFVPTEPAVEELARAEEARMRAEPGYRSDRRTLHRLSHTEAVFDLSGGRRRPFDFGGLGLALARRIAEEFGGDRALAERRCAARVARVLGLPNRGLALRRLAPVLAMIPDLAVWPACDRRALARVVRAKDARSETAAARLMAAHARFDDALRRLARE